MDELEGLRSEYERLRPRYCALVKEVQFALAAEIKKRGIKVAAVTGRAKTTDSVMGKIERKHYENPLEEIDDLAGVRIVCLFNDDLEIVREIVTSSFIIDETQDKTQELGLDRMGYQSWHYIVRFPDHYSGARYSDLRDLRCEIQIRNVLQDAWAQLSQNLVYKSENAIPPKIRRQVNNLASLLETAQDVFESIRSTRRAYVSEIDKKRKDSDKFLSQRVDSDTLTAFTMWKYPKMTVDPNVHAFLVRDSVAVGYETLRDIDRAVNAAQAVVETYRNEQPGLFKSGSDYLTKSLGFADENFAEAHPFGPTTREAIKKYAPRVAHRRGKGRPPILN